MQSRERVALYSLLIVSLAASGFSLLAATTPAAIAQGTPAAPGSIAIAGEGGDLVLTNRKGRLAWADSDYAKAYSIAFVHIGKVLKQLREAERYKEEMEALHAELEGTDANYREQLDAIRNEAQGIQQESPEGAELFEKWQKIYGEYMEWNRTAMERRNKLEAEQSEKAYRDLVEAVEVVADRKKIDLVYRFIATSDPFEATDAEQAQVEIRLRSVLKYPEGLDITPDVLAELSLQDE
jgi:hypothetical protein